MCSGVGSRVLLDWVSPFGHPRITARLPTPRGLSQAPTSFIGSWYQDIHRLPLVACHKTNNKRQNYATKDARVHYTVLKIRAGTPATTRHLPRRTPHPGKQHTRTRNPRNGLPKAGPSHPPHQPTSM